MATEHKKQKLGSKFTQAELVLALKTYPIWDRLQRSIMSMGHDDGEPYTKERAHAVVRSHFDDAMRVLELHDIQDVHQAAHLVIAYFAFVSHNLSQESLAEALLHVQFLSYLSAVIQPQ